MKVSNRENRDTRHEVTGMILLKAKFRQGQKRGYLGTGDEFAMRMEVLGGVLSRSEKRITFRSGGRSFGVSKISHSDREVRTLRPVREYSRKSREAATIEQSLKGGETETTYHIESPTEKGQPS